MQREPVRRFLVDTWLSSLYGKPRLRRGSQLSAWEALPCYTMVAISGRASGLQSLVPSYLHAGVESSSCPASHLPRGRRSLHQFRNSNSEHGLSEPLSRYQHAAAGEPQ